MTLSATARSAAIGSMLVLGACADGREAGRDIVWESERVAPSGAAQAATGASPPGLDADGCREYTQTIRIGGEEHEAYGRACLQPDGSWRIYAPGAAAQEQATPPRRAEAAPAYPYYRPYYAPPVFFGSAFFLSHKRFRHHHHHRHGHFKHGHKHRR